MPAAVPDSAARAVAAHQVASASPGRARRVRARPRSPPPRPELTPTTSCPRRISAPSSPAHSASTRSSRGCGRCSAQSRDCRRRARGPDVPRRRGVAEPCGTGPMPAASHPVQQAAVVQQIQDLSGEAVGLRCLPEPRLPFQYQRPHSGQAQFKRQHQPGRPGPHDDHVDVHHRRLPTQSFLASTCDLCVVNSTSISVSLVVISDLWSCGLTGTAVPRGQPARGSCSMRLGPTCG